MKKNENWVKDILSFLIWLNRQQQFKTLKLIIGFDDEKYELLYWEVNQFYIAKVCESALNEYDRDEIVKLIALLKQECKNTYGIDLKYQFKKRIL